MLNKLNVPLNKINGKSVNPKETSYAIICAADRNAPINAYFELLDQPAKIKLYTFIDEINKTNNNE